MSANVSLSVLGRVRIASPCSMNWDDMQPVGDDGRVRHCDQCKLNVFNLSEMTRAEAEALVLNRQGRLCAGFFQRADGTVLTRDCPVGLAAVRARAARAVSRVAAALAFVLGGAVLLGARSREQERLRGMEPFATIVRWLTPPSVNPLPVQQQFIKGEVYVMPPTGASNQAK